jgi:hypothetical protein
VEASIYCRQGTRHGGDQGEGQPQRTDTGGAVLSAHCGTDLGREQQPDRERRLPRIPRLPQIQRPLLYARGLFESSLRCYEFRYVRCYHKDNSEKVPISTLTTLSPWLCRKNSISTSRSLPFPSDRSSQSSTSRIRQSVSVAWSHSAADPLVMLCVLFRFYT